MIQTTTRLDSPCVKPSSVMSGRGKTENVQVIRVDSCSSAQLHQRVSALRAVVYGQQLRHKNMPSRDQQDCYSTSFLCVRNGVDVGTIRYTSNNDGPLELYGQTEQWDGLLNEHSGTIAQISRLVVLPSQRTSSALNRLLLACLQQAIADQSDWAFTAADDYPPLIRLYRIFGFTAVDADSISYQLDGDVIGHGKLMKFNMHTTASKLRSRLTAGLEK